MKTKRYNLFNYGITWLGIIRLSIAIYAIVWIFRVVNSDNTLLLKIALIFICIICIGACLIEGLPNIKEGISKAKNCSDDFLYGRIPPNFPNKKE